MSDDKQTFKRMLWGFIIICICCGVMHIIMVKKGNLYLERSTPRYTLDREDVTGEMLEGVGVVEGEVGAVSHDQFFLILKDGKLQAILKGDVEMPKVGDLVSVTYAGGRPPKALLVKITTKTSTE